MRDIVERICISVIDRVRPAPFLAEVISIDEPHKKAIVRTAGQVDIESDLEVNFTQTLIPAQPRPIDESTSGNIVEVGGKPGNYFITKIISGSWTMSGNV